MFTVTGKEGWWYKIHSEIASLLGGGAILKKSGVLVIRPEDTEEGCEFLGILHIDGVVLSGRQQSGPKCVIKKYLVTWDIFQVPCCIRGFDLLDTM
jgi:hypothetical protein